jgi:hypothetical protein
MLAVVIAYSWSNHNPPLYIIIFQVVKQIKTNNKITLYWTKQSHILSLWQHEHIHWRGQWIILAYLLLIKIEALTLTLTFMNFINIISVMISIFLFRRSVRYTNIWIWIYQMKNIPLTHVSIRDDVNKIHKGQG